LLVGNYGVLPTNFAFIAAFQNAVKVTLLTPNLELLLATIGIVR
jgi:hypothetical protein